MRVRVAIQLVHPRKSRILLCACSSSHQSNLVHYQRPLNVVSLFRNRESTDERATVDWLRDAYGERLVCFHVDADAEAEEILCDALKHGISPPAADSKLILKDGLADAAVDRPLQLSLPLPRVRSKFMKP